MQLQLMERKNMKLRKWIGWSSVLCLSGSLLQAQDTNIADTFERKLKEMQESFQKAQLEMKENFEKKLNEQRQEIDALRKEVAAKTNAPPGAPAIAPVL